MSASNRSQKQNIEKLVVNYTERVALGLEEGATTWNKFGYNEDVDTGADEVIAAFGGAFNQKLANGETLSIVSTSSEDASGGTGVRLLVIFGVDDDWNEVTDVVAMTGVTPVTSNYAFRGINRMTIYTSGTSLSNVGLITATASSSGNTMATMPVAQGTTQQCIFYVPAGKTFLASWQIISATKSSGGGTAKIDLRGFVYSAVVDSQFEVFRDEIDLSSETSIQLTPEDPFVIGEKSIYWLTATTTANNTSVRGRFSGKLVTNAS